MNGQCRGKLQALLTSLQTQSNQPTVDVKQIEEKMTEFFMKLQSYIRGNHKLTEDLESCGQENIRLNDTISRLKEDLSGTQEVIDKQQAEIERYKTLCGVMTELKQSLNKSQSTISEYKSDIEEMEVRVTQSNKRIEELNTTISQRDCLIDQLNNKIKLNTENSDMVEEDLKTERDNSESLRQEIEKLKNEHREQMEKYKLEMSEKLIKVQSRLAQQSASCGGDTSSGGIDYREIFKKKMAFVETKYQREITDLKKTISRLQQSR